MFHFNSREIKDSDTLGCFFRAQREAQGMSLSYISHKILIAEDYLAHLEHGEYESLPGMLYVKNFVKRYAQFLGFDPEEVCAVYGKELDAEARASRSDQQPRLPLSYTHFITWPKLMMTSVVSIAALVLFGYLGYMAYGFLQPPNLTIYQPLNNIVVEGKSIVVEGETDPEVIVTINNIPISVERGYFKEELELQEGMNLIEVAATKKHGGRNVQKRTVVVNKDASTISKSYKPQ